jgi:hypothetical protein
MTERTDQRGDGEVGVCHICGVTFPTQQQLAAHLMNDHDGEILPVDGSE